MIKQEYVYIAVVALIGLKLFKKVDVKPEVIVLLLVLGMLVCKCTGEVEGFTGSWQALDSDAFLALNAIVKSIVSSEDGGTLVIPSNLHILGKCTVGSEKQGNEGEIRLMNSEDNGGATIMKSIGGSSGAPKMSLGSTIQDVLADTVSVKSMLKYKEGGIETI